MWYWKQAIGSALNPLQVGAAQPAPRAWEKEPWSAAASTCSVDPSTAVPGAEGDNDSEISFSLSDSFVER